MRQADEPSLPTPDGWSALQPEAEHVPSDAEVEAIRGLGGVALGAELAVPSGAAAQRRPGVALIVAILIHLGVLGFIWQLGGEAGSLQLGAGGSLLEGVAIEVVSPAELAVVQLPRLGAAAIVMAGEPQPIVGAVEIAPPVEPVDPAGAAARAEQADGEERREPPKQAAGATVDAAADPAVAPPDVPVIEVARQPEPKAGDDDAVPAPQKQARVEVVEPVADPAPEQQAFRPPSQDAATEGGAPAIMQPAVEAALAAAAAPGEVSELGRRIQGALERVRPAPLGVRGRVVLEITVGSSGGLEALSVLESSGNPRLDNAAVAAARRVDYPAPGSHFTRTQRIYHVPYLFK